MNHDASVLGNYNTSRELAAKNKLNQSGSQPLTFVNADIGLAAAEPVLDEPGLEMHQHLMMINDRNKVKIPAAH